MPDSSVEKGVESPKPQGLHSAHAHRPQLQLGAADSQRFSALSSTLDYARLKVISLLVSWGSWLALLQVGRKFVNTCKATILKTVLPY